MTHAYPVDAQGAELPLMNKRLPCPFCGGNAELDRIEHPPRMVDDLVTKFFYRCISCACCGGWGRSESSALKMWNMRASLGDNRTSMPMTYETLLERIISDGIAEVRESYADPKDHHKRDGAIEGFEACRGKTPAELVELCHEAEDEAVQIKRRNVEDLAFMKVAYWRQRYKALQIEWICNVISVGLTTNGQAPLLTHLPTVRAAMKYAEIVGVRDDRGMR